MLASLYVGRSFHLWKDPNLLPWLEKNVHKVLARVDAAGIGFFVCPLSNSLIHRIWCASYSTSLDQRILKGRIGMHIRRS